MAVYPNLSAGQRLTAGLLTSMLPTFALKAAATSRTSTTTLANDPDLQLALEANATYFVEARLAINSSPGARFKTAWSLPSGASANRRVNGPGSTAVEANADNMTAKWGIHGAATPIVYGVRGTSGTPTVQGTQYQVYETAIVVTGATAGNVVIQWAQDVSSATATVMAAQSTLRAERWA